MRTLLAAILCLLPAAGWTDDVTVRSAVAAARIFPAGAIVTREIHVSLPAGAHRIAVPDLPRDLRVDTLRVGADAPGAPVVAALNFRERSAPPAPETTPQMAAAERALAEAEAARDALLAERAEARGAAESARLRRAYLTALAEAGGPAGDSAAAGDVAALADQIGRQIAQATQDAAAAKAALGATGRELQERRAAVDRAQAALAAVTPLTPETGTLVLDVTAAAAFDGVLSLSYAVGAAGWRPGYDITLDQDGATGALRLIRQAVVYQTTGGDWSDVALTVSTAALDRPGQVTLPDSTLYWLRDRDAPVPLAKTARGQAADSVQMQMEPMAAESAPRDAMAGGTAALRGQTLEFDLGRIAALDGDGSEQLVRLDAIARDAAPLTARANARQDSFAYLYTDLTNDTGGMLLAGPAAVYRDGTLVGHVQVPQTAAGAVAELPLGPLDGVQIDHRVLEFEAGDSRFITARNTRAERFEVQIDSTLDYAIDLTVFAALPVAEDEDLDIRLDTDPAPTGRAVEGRRGVVGWTRPLPAGASQTITYGWTLRWPEDRVLMQRPVGIR